MKRSGSVTVFLALVITCSSALICALTESARTAGARFYVRTMADSAIDSLFSEYHPQLWECYRLLAYAYRSDETCAQEMENFMKPYLEDCGWYAVSAPEVTPVETTFLTDGGGVWFEQEILDYMKYGWIDVKFTPETAEKLWKELKEAQTMNSILKDYGGESREAAAMEKALSQIEKNLKEQNQKKKEARQLLLNGKNTEFQRKASGMEVKIKALPGLIENFDRKADRFAVRMTELEEKHAAGMETLKPENREIIENQISEYRQYTDANGIRRLKIDALDDNNAGELSTISSVRKLANDTREYIDDYNDNKDPDDEDLDEAALWKAVANAWDRVAVPQSDEHTGIADEKTEKKLESLLDIVDSGFLGLVVPEDREVSEQSADTALLPSRTSVTERDSAVLRDLMCAAAVDAYAGKYLTSFTDKAEQRPLLYELEYAVAGKVSDKENLSAALREILVIREALNFMFIMTDAEKYRASRDLALAITAGGATPALTVLVQCLVVSVWALLESILDLRLLLQGKKAALFKTKEDWMLNNVLDIFSFVGDREASDSHLKEASTGITYESYLQMLLFVKTPAERDYRIMDVLQLNIRQDDGSFLMKDCLYGLHAEVECSSRHIFTLLGISRTGEVSPQFTITETAVKAY